MPALVIASRACSGGEGGPDGLWSAIFTGSLSGSVLGSQSLTSFDLPNLAPRHKADDIPQISARTWVHTDPPIRGGNLHKSPRHVDDPSGLGIRDKMLCGNQHPVTAGPRTEYCGFVSGNKGSRFGVDTVSPNDKIGLYGRAVVQSQGGILAVEAHHCCVGVDSDRRAKTFRVNGFPFQLIVQVNTVNEKPLLEVRVLLGKLFRRSSLSDGSDVDEGNGGQHTATQLLASSSVKTFIISRSPSLWRNLICSIWFQRIPFFLCSSLGLNSPQYCAHLLCLQGECPSGPGRPLRLVRKRLLRQFHCAPLLSQKPAKKSFSVHGNTCYRGSSVFTSISCPCRRRARAAVRPPIPPPAMATFSRFVSAIIILTVMGVGRTVRLLYNCLY